MNSFFIRNLRRDSDPRSSVNFNPTFENSLMLLPIFTSCVLMEVSKGEMKGTALANWNKLSLEQYMKRSKDPKTYKVAPKTASTGGSLPYKTFRNISAINVDG